ncbi:MAG: hypothetical protein IBX69_04220 [Anaerolineales bacterium]|nr:hypothetical protein [Anaerolineales bacterium]
MSVRPFDWRDLPKLHKYRKRGLYLDNTLVLTRGPALVPARALLSYFAPATGVFTYLSWNNGSTKQPLIGQVTHEYKSAHAKLSYLAPFTSLRSPSFPSLIEYMIVKVGERGAFHLLAEIDEYDPAFDVLRDSSFAIYARQRIWSLPGEPASQRLSTPWRASTERDNISIKTLYNNLVPGLVQQIEPLPANSPEGLVFSQGNDLQAFIEIKSGPRGIWIQPFVHPDADQLPARMADLLQNMPFRGSRPVHLCIRSYQSWLEPALDDLGAIPGPLQTVMVKHLAVAKRVAHSFRLKTLDAGRPEATAPMARSECKK